MYLREILFVAPLKKRFKKIITHNYERELSKIRKLM